MVHETKQRAQKGSCILGGKLHYDRRLHGHRDECVPTNHLRSAPMVLGFNYHWLHLFHSVLRIDHMGLKTEIRSPGVIKIQRKMGCFVLRVKDRKIRSSHLLPCFHWKEIYVRASLLD